MSLTALREIFRDVDHSSLPHDLALCLAWNKNTITANHAAYREWEHRREESRILAHFIERSSTADTVDPLCTTYHSPLAEPHPLPTFPTTAASHPLVAPRPLCTSRATTTVDPPRTFLPIAAPNPTHTSLPFATMDSLRTSVSSATLDPHRTSVATLDSLRTSVATLDPLRTSIATATADSLRTSVATATVDPLRTPLASVTPDPPRTSRAHLFIATHDPLHTSLPRLSALPPTSDRPTVHEPIDRSHQPQTTPLPSAPDNKPVVQSTTLPNSSEHPLPSNPLLSNGLLHSGHHQQKSSWDPQILFPEIASPSPAVPTPLITSPQSGSTPKEPTHMSASHQPRPSVRINTDHNLKGCPAIVEIDAQDFVDIPLQLAEGREILALIGATAVPIPSHLMAAPLYLLLSSTRWANRAS